LGFKEFRNTAVQLLCHLGERARRFESRVTRRHGTSRGLAHRMGSPGSLDSFSLVPEPVTSIPLTLTDVRLVNCAEEAFDMFEWRCDTPALGGALDCAGGSCQLTPPPPPPPPPTPPPPPSSDGAPPAARCKGDPRKLAKNSSCAAAPAE